MPLRKLLTPILLFIAAFLAAPTSAATLQGAADEDVPTIQEEGEFYVINISEAPDKALTRNDLDFLFSVD